MFYSPASRWGRPLTSGVYGVTTDCTVALGAVGDAPRATQRTLTNRPAIPDVGDIRTYTIRGKGSHMSKQMTRPAATLLVAITVIIFMVGTFQPAHAATPGPAPSQAGTLCVSDFNHHDAGKSPYLARITSGKVWGLVSTGDVIAAVWIAECGKYLIAIYRGGQFTTHFLTSWGYVMAQVAGMKVRTWATVTVASLWFVIVPCPGTWSTVRPCPAPTKS